VNSWVAQLLDTVDSEVGFGACLYAYDARPTSMTLPAVCTTGALRSSPYRYTGKERDTESDNDYFGARYYSSSMGRFMSPDWSAKAEPVPYAKMDNPQSLNLYSYVLNNPATNRDADGHICIFGIGNTCTPAPPPLPPPPPPPAPGSTPGALPAPAPAPKPTPPPASTCGNQCHLSAAAQHGFLQVDTDKNVSVVALPAVAVSATLTVDPSKPDQQVLATPSVGVGKWASIGTDIVKNPDGTVRPQGVQVGGGGSFPPYPANVTTPIDNLKPAGNNWQMLIPMPPTPDF